MRVLPPPVRLILASMVLFNVGFYLVVPFLAVHLADELHLAAWAIGLVPGLRTFSQQGLFFLGGSLADRFGARPIVLLGVALRVVAFVALGFAEHLWSMIVARRARRMGRAAPRRANADGAADARRHRPARRRAQPGRALRDAQHGRGAGDPGRIGAGRMDLRPGRRGAHDCDRLSPAAPARSAPAARR
ncbi:MFS transporter [Pseudonocardia oceani]|uniref:MFS transporter n=1 Tax=Pseudonocardia oceani TaxID=2792013 RepID=UPI001CF7DFA4|nr:MFS transporter [Pseudonocardia oceani]